MSNSTQSSEELASTLKRTGLDKLVDEKQEEDFDFLDYPSDTQNSDNDEPSEHPRVRSIPVPTTTSWTSTVLSDPKNRLALAALSTHDLASITKSQAKILTTPQTFNVLISLEGAPVTNQRSSGRCWLFASTNVFRVALMKHYNLEEFELSQAWLFFWDKLEKANWFLENVIDLIDDDEGVEGRLMQELLKAPVNDGGQWDMVAALVKKYGLVPQTLYPDSFSAMNSSQMDRLLTAKLRENALKLRQMMLMHMPHSKVPLSTKLTTAKKAMLADVHRILTLSLGPPPSPNKKFIWSYYDAAGVFHCENVHTPLTFAAQLSTTRCRIENHGTDVHELFSLVNDPRNKYYTHLTVSRLGNVVPSPSSSSGSKPSFQQVSYVNVPAAVLKKACIAMLRADHPVFFGCDVGQESDSAKGIMAHGLFDYSLAFNVELGMDKAARLQVGQSAATHAMVFTGVEVESVEVTDSETGIKRSEARSVRWRVQNSWGDTAGEKGWFVMDDEWFSEWVYQAVVDPRFVSDEILKVRDQEPKVLPLWDPMGALA